MGKKILLAHTGMDKGLPIAHKQRQRKAQMKY
jgi:hypothetical protein